MFRSALPSSLLGRVLKYGSPRSEFFHIIKLYSSRFIRKSWQESRRGGPERSDAADDAPRRTGKIMRAILNFNCDFNYGIKTKETRFLPMRLISSYVGRICTFILNCYSHLLFLHAILDMDGKCVCFFVTIVSRNVKNALFKIQLIFLFIGLCYVFHAKAPFCIETSFIVSFKLIWNRYSEDKFCLREIILTKCKVLLKSINEI